MHHVSRGPNSLYPSGRSVGSRELKDVCSGRGARSMLLAGFRPTLETHHIEVHMREVLFSSRVRSHAHAGVKRWPAVGSGDPVLWILIIIG